MRAFVGGVALLGLGVVLACGDASTDEDANGKNGSSSASQRDAGLDADSEADADSADANSARNPSVACIALANQAAMELGSDPNAAAEEACSTDDDCTLVQAADSCDLGCPEIVSKSGVSDFQAALAKENSGTCATFLASGCFSLAHGCVAEVGDETPQCVANSCVPGLPAAWTSFALQVDTAFILDPTSQPGPCSSATCSSWTLTPDGNVQTSTSAGTRTVALAATDFATVNAALRDGGFRQGLLAQARTVAHGPFLACTPRQDAGAAEPSAVASMAWNGISTVGSASDCVANGASANSVAAVYQVLKHY